MQVTCWQARLLWLAMACLGFFWLASLVRANIWPFDALDKLILSDFSAVWAAGRRVLEGQAALAYDMVAHDRFIGHLAGREAPSALIFGYPPAVLLAAALPALAPYPVALLLYLGTGLAVFAWILGRISGDRLTGLVMALSVGGPTATLWLGQNGFLTASAIAGGFLLLQHRKVAAGVCFGLLTLKPHLAIAVLPALLVWREWRALGIALATIIASAVMPTAVFGFAIWAPYWDATRAIASIVAANDWWIVGGLMQSPYAALLQWVQPGTAAFAHFVIGAAAIGASISIPASRPNERAAAVIAATLLAAPYSLLYDATMAVAAVGFLLRGTRNLSLHLAGAAVLLWLGSWFLAARAVVPLTAALILLAAILRARTRNDAMRHDADDGVVRTSRS